MKLRRICCVLFATLTMMLSVYASAAPAATEEIAFFTENSDTARAEETVWKYRVYEGRWQKRLWSITRGIWLTDWEYC